MDVRHRTCEQCGKQFDYVVGRGKDRIFCGDVCAKAAAKESRMLRAASYKQCSVDGCCKPANRVVAGLCEMHYTRQRRNGSLDKVDVVIPGELVHAAGYLLVYAPDHALRRGSSPRVYEHRKVFYDAHGAGPFSCHVCGSTVTWGDMHVDHLNDVVTDNRLENLAPACPTCNQKRGHHKVKRSMKSKHGKHMTAHGVTMCEADWARHLGLSRGAITDRLARGASLEDALRPRVGKHGPKSKSRVPLDDLLVIEDARQNGDRSWAV